MMRALAAIHIAGDTACSCALVLVLVVGFNIVSVPSGISSVSVKISDTNSLIKCSEPVWPSRKALGW